MSNRNSKRYEACIFDMDGVLIDSEPFWRQAELEVFSAVGIRLTEEDCIETMGIRIDEIVNMRYRQHPWSGPSCAEVSEKIQDRVIELIKEKGKALPGVYEAIALLKGTGLKIALASSSSYRLIKAILQTLNLEEAFTLLYSAEQERFGKPHPAVFITTAQKLKVEPTNCLVIEDSPNGVIAAKAALMTCIAVPEKAMADDPRFAIADFKLSSLLELRGVKISGNS
ncbi:hexitol phosphatase HxpB [bacterium]|nr:hexitol phosphatase HxpB [bacterium]